MKDKIFIFLCVIFLNSGNLLAQGFNYIDINYNAECYKKYNVKNISQYFIVKQPDGKTVRDSVLQEKIYLNSHGLIVSYEFQDDSGKMFTAYEYKYNKKRRLVEMTRHANSKNYGNITRYIYNKKGALLQEKNYRPGSEEELVCKKYVYNKKRINCTCYLVGEDTLFDIREIYVDGRLSKKIYDDGYYDQIMYDDQERVTEVQTFSPENRLEVTVKYDYHSSGFIEMVRQDYENSEIYVEYTYEFDDSGLPVKQIIRDNMISGILNVVEEDKEKRMEFHIYYEYFEK